MKLLLWLLAFCCYLLKAEEGFYLPKRCFDNQTRTLLAVGLEGSGLQALREMFQYCIAKNLCKTHSKLNKLLLRAYEKGYHGLFSAEDAHRSFENIESVKLLMQQNQQRSPDPVLILLCTGKHVNCGSFPITHGEHRPSDHPDLLSLSIAAEATRTDLRVLVLLRDGQELLTHADTHRRKFDGSTFGYATHPKVLVDNAAALLAQLKMLDRSFYHCINYRWSIQYIVYSI